MVIRVEGPSGAFVTLLLIKILGISSLRLRAFARGYYLGAGHFIISLLEQIDLL